MIRLISYILLCSTKKCWEQNERFTKGILDQKVRQHFGRAQSFLSLKFTLAFDLVAKSGADHDERKMYDQFLNNLAE